MHVRVLLGPLSKSRIGRLIGRLIDVLVCVSVRGTEAADGAGSGWKRPAVWLQSQGTARVDGAARP